ATFSPNGTIVVRQRDVIVQKINDPDDILDSLVLYNATTGKELAKIDKVGSGIVGRCFSPDSKVLAWGTTRGQARLWDVAGSKTIHLLGPVNRSQVRSLSFSPDGKLLAVTRTDRTIELWDAVKGKQLHQVGSPPSAPGNHVGGAGTPPQAETAFSPDGRILAS